MNKKGEIELRANSLLKQFSIKKAPVAVEDIVIGLGLSIREDEFGDSVSGFLISKDKNNVIGINRAEIDVRKRFTIAHELGHFMLHSNQKDDIFISKVHFRNEASTTGEIRKEREANSFAANILMPAKFIIREINKIDKQMSIEDLTAKLAKTFKVSDVAMSYRLTNLNYIL